jgi:hypothetical protein
VLPLTSCIFFLQPDVLFLESVRAHSELIDKISGLLQRFQNESKSLYDWINTFREILTLLLQSVLSKA